jgi:hypothetical protein
MENDTLIKTYSGSESTAIIAFERESSTLKSKGYYPISQSYQQGLWGAGAFIFAVLLCFILVGILALIYMMIVKPNGTLTVRYKMINKSELNEFISLFVDNENICGKDRELRKMFEKISNNNLNITNEDVTRAIAKIDQLIKNNSASLQNNLQSETEHSNSDDDIFAKRIRQIKSLMDEGLIDENEFSKKKKEILSSL